MLRHPQSRASPDTLATQVAGLKPSAGASFHVICRMVRNQRFGRHRQKCGCGAHQKHQRGQQRQIAGRYRNQSACRDSGGCQCGADRIPGFSIQRGVGERGPEELPGLGKQVRGDHGRDLRRVDASLGELVGQRDHHEARADPERQDQHQVDERVRWPRGSRIGARHPRALRRGRASIASATAPSPAAPDRGRSSCPPGTGTAEISTPSACSPACRQGSCRC